ncbi:MAG: helix-turn-helix domain-containing protein [Planctomycetaceae bacterium]|nr:helix-turn-helix domain-containing protein [Planctomycetaceae bacterium]
MTRQKIKPMQKMRQSFRAMLSDVKLNLAELGIGGGSGQHTPDPSARGASWPPDFGWHFQPGGFAFRGIRGELNGIPLRLLEALAKAPRGKSLPESDLRNAGWDEADAPSVENATIRAHLATVRKALRNAFGISAKDDPIPVKDRTAERRGWMLDSDLLLSFASVKS